MTPRGDRRKVNADLANSFGNLASARSPSSPAIVRRAAAGGKGDPADAAPARHRPVPPSRDDLPPIRGAGALERDRGVAQGGLRLHQYIDAQAPWALKKTDPERLIAVLATLYQAIVDSRHRISRVIPASAAKLLDAMAFGRRRATMPRSRMRAATISLAGSRFVLTMAAPIFPRLEAAPEG